jgi:hypothetical protein
MLGSPQDCVDVNKNDLAETVIILLQKGIEEALLLEKAPVESGLIPSVPNNLPDGA